MGTDPETDPGAGPADPESGHATAVEEVAEPTLLAEAHLPNRATTLDVPYTHATDGIHIVNLSEDVVLAHARELIIAGKHYAHVAEDAVGRWLYRHDK